MIPISIIILVSSVLAGKPEHKGPDIARCTVDSAGTDPDPAALASGLAGHTVAHHSRHIHSDSRYWIFDGGSAVEASAGAPSEAEHFLALPMPSHHFGCHIDAAFAAELAGIAGDSHCAPSFTEERPTSSPLESAQVYVFSCKQEIGGSRGCRVRPKKCG